MPATNKRLLAVMSKLQHFVTHEDEKIAYVKEKHRHPGLEWAGILKKNNQRLLVSKIFEKEDEANKYLEVIVECENKKNTKFYGIHTTSKHKFYISVAVDYLDISTGPYVNNRLIAEFLNCVHCPRGGEWIGSKHIENDDSYLRYVAKEAIDKRSFLVGFDENAAKYGFDDDLILEFRVCLNEFSTNILFLDCFRITSRDRFVIYLASLAYAYKQEAVFNKQFARIISAEILSRLWPSDLSPEITSYICEFLDRHDIKNLIQLDKKSADYALETKKELFLQEKNAINTPETVIERQQWSTAIKSSPASDNNSEVAPKKTTQIPTAPSAPSIKLEKLILPDTIWSKTAVRTTPIVEPTVKFNSTGTRIRLHIPLNITEEGLLELFNLIKDYIPGSQYTGPIPKISTSVNISLNITNTILYLDNKKEKGFTIIRTELQTEDFKKLLEKLPRELYDAFQSSLSNTELEIPERITKMASLDQL